MNQTKKKMLEGALKGLSKYIKRPDADPSIIAQYLIDLAAWCTAVEPDSTNPPPPPPPPPGH